MTYKKISETMTTKELLDDAVAHLMTEKGEQFSIRDICSYAGVSIGTFYTYYKSKDEVRLARLQYMDKHLLEEVAQQLEGTSGEKLIQFLLGYLKRSQYRGLSFTREVYKSILNSSVTQEEAQGRVMYQLIYEIIREGQEKGEFNAQETANALTDMTVAFIRGIPVDWCHKQGAYDMMEFAQKACQIWVDGLQAK